jgi:hypothetical protein
MRRSVTDSGCLSDACRKLDIAGALQYNNSLRIGRMAHLKYLDFFPQVSGFRLSLGQRLIAAALILVPLWAAVIWAIR